MIAVMISSSGASWTFYAAAGDKIFLIENMSPPDDKTGEAMQHLVRESRWLFGDRRIVYQNRDKKWMELLHDGTGRLWDIIHYDGPVPIQQETNPDV
jgi:hypothetical protein